MYVVSENVLKGSSNEQRKIILSSGAISVSACPGSGKTWTAARLFINRVKHKSNHFRGVALLSHTNVAVETFKQRILEVEPTLDVDRINYVGTIDSFVEKYLISPFYYLFQNLDKRPYNFDFDSDAITLPKKIANTPYPIRLNDIKCFISESGLIYRAKNRKNSNQYFDLPSVPVRELFIRNINNFARYTHDMRWFIVYEIIKYTDALRCLANKFSEIIIDEAQDTKEVAYVFFDRLKEAASLPLHISLVGDINQSIYSFAGATPDAYKKYVNKWGLKKYHLTINRRSSYQVIRGIDSLFGVKMESTFSDADSGIYFISKTQYEQIGVEQILDRFGVSISSVCFLSRRNTSSKRRATLYIQTLFDACYKRDYENNPKAAYRELISFVKAYGNFSFPDDDTVNPYIWEMVKNKTLLPPLDMTWKNWRNMIKASLMELSENLGIADLNLNYLRQPVQLDSNQLISDFLKTESKIQTVHSVKGETCDGVIFIDDDFQWKRLLEYKTENDIIENEELRIAYVAVTRARKFVLLVIPDKHLINNRAKWKSKICEFPSDAYYYDFKLQ